MSQRKVTRPATSKIWEGIGRSRALVAHQLPSDPLALSYSIGANLRIDNLERQDLLETTSVAHRLRKEKDLLERSKAGGAHLGDDDDD